jgi:hypothetical protein
MYEIEGPEDGGKAPKGPNFLLIVCLFCAAILVCFGLAFLFIPSFARMIRPVNPDHHPTSYLVMAAADCSVA